MDGASTKMLACGGVYDRSVVRFQPVMVVGPHRRDPASGFDDTSGSTPVNEVTPVANVKEVRTGQLV